MSSRKIMKLLELLLADTYALYLKTQSYHWNIEGKNFYPLHAVFEQDYKQLANKIDIIAERIRMLQEKVLATFEEFSSTSKISAANPHFSARDMLEDLMYAHNYMCNTIIDAINVCEQERDYMTNSILTDQLAFHQKVLWMLKSNTNSQL